MRNYVADLLADESIDAVDAATTNWVVERLEDKEVDDIDTALNLHPELQIRINGLAGKYEGMAEKSKKKRDHQHAEVQKANANNPEIKGSGKISLLKNIADTDPLYVQHNWRYVKCVAAHRFFVQIGFTLKDRKDVLVQLNKNLREDTE